MPAPGHPPAHPLLAACPGPTLVVQTLLTMARQRDGLSEPACRTVLEFMEAGGAVSTRIRRQLAEDGLSRSKFALLLALFAIDPVPASASDLTLHTGIGRPSVSSAVTALARQRLVVCERGSPDRRLSYVGLTPAGREVTDRASLHCLRLLGQIARLLPAALQAELRLGCALLQAGAAGGTPGTPSLQP